MDQGQHPTLLQNMLDRIRDPIAAVDANLAFLGFNQAYRIEFDSSFAGKLEIGSPLLELLVEHPGLRTEVARLFQRALEGESFEHVVTLTPPGRPRRTFELSFNPLQDAHNVTIGVIHLARDVTAHRVDRSKLDRQNRLLASLGELVRSFITGTSSSLVYDLLLDTLLDHTESEFGFVGEVQHSAAGDPVLKVNALTNIAWSDPTRVLYANRQENGLEFHNMKSLFGHVILSGEPVISNDPSSDPRRCGLPPGHPPLRSFMGLPILRGTEVRGMVAVANRHGGYAPGLAKELEPLLSTYSAILVGNEFAAHQRRLSVKIGGLNQVLEEVVAQRTEDLHEAERRYRTLLDNLQGLAYRRRKDRSGSMEFVSEGCREVLGIAPEELTSGRKTLRDLMDPAMRAEVEAQVRQNLAAKRPSQHEYRVRHSSGQWRWVWEQTRGVYSENGELLCVEGFIADITRRKAAELRAGQYDRQLRALLDGIPDMAWLKDVEGRFVAVNRAMALALGRPMEEIVGQIDGHFMPLEKAQHIHAGDLEVIRTGKMRRSEDVCGNSEGTQCWTDTIKVPILDTDGVVTGTAGIARDITERHLANLRLAESDRFVRGCLDALSAHIAILDDTGLILATNLAWDDFTLQEGGDPTTTGKGANYLAACDAAHGIGCAEAATTARGIRAVLSGEKPSYFLEYRCESPLNPGWYVCRITRFPGEGPARVVIAHQNITVARNTEMQLDSTRGAFETLAHVTPVGILRADAHGSCFFVNRRWLQFSGMTLDQALGSGWLGAIHEADRQETAQNWASFQNGERPFRREIRFQPPDGGRTWVLGEAARVQGGAGELVGYILIFTDVTEHKQSERALRALTGELAQLKGHAFFERMVECLVALLDVEIGVLCQRRNADEPMTAPFVMRVDGQAAEMAPFPIAGTPVERIYADGSLMVPSGMRRLFPNLEFLRLNQVEAFAGVALRDSVGNHFGHISVMSRRPFTNAREVETILRLFGVSTASELIRSRSEKQFADLFEFAPDGMLMVNEAGTIVLVNERAEALFGYGSQELLGESIERLVSEKLRADHRNHRGDYAAVPFARTMGRAVTDLKAVRKDGTAFPADISLSPIVLEDGLKVVAAVRDVTDRVQSNRALAVAKKTIEEERSLLATRVEERTAELKAANLALIEAGKAKETFFANMSHELRTPLNGLLGMLDLLGTTPMSVSQASSLRLAMESGQSLATIIDDILDYSRVKAGKLAVRPRPCLIDEVVEVARQTFEVAAHKKGLTLRTIVDPELRPMVLDSHRLAQILKNFVSNAVKFTEQGGIEIRASLKDRGPDRETVCLTVSDSGEGIPLAHQARVFQAYEQVDAGNTPSGMGTGLGLAICRTLTELMEGKIDLESTLGRGTTLSVTFTFPVCLASEAEVQVQERLDDTIEDDRNLSEVLSSGVVLGVDDHPVNRTLLQLQLRELGIRCVVASGAEEALALWRAGNYALVITDCRMAPIDGYELARRIRRSEDALGQAPIPIVAWTAAAFAEDVEQSVDAGMNDHLSKPATLKDLRRIVGRWLMASPVPVSQRNPSPLERSPIDSSVLEQLSTSPVERQAILNDYLDQTRLDLQELATSLSSVNSSQHVSHIAHRLKGAAQLVGALEITALSQEMEAAARSDDVVGCRKLQLALQKALELVSVSTDPWSVT